MLDITHYNNKETCLYCKYLHITSAFLQNIGNKRKFQNYIKKLLLFSLNLAKIYKYSLLNSHYIEMKISVNDNNTT